LHVFLCFIVASGEVESEQQSNQILNSSVNLASSGSFSRLKQSQRIMTQEMRGLGSNSAQRARNTISLKSLSI